MHTNRWNALSARIVVVHELLMSSFNPWESGWWIEGALQGRRLLAQRGRKPLCCTISTNLLCVCERERLFLTDCAPAWFITWSGVEGRRGRECMVSEWPQPARKPRPAKERGSEKWKLRLTLFSFLLTKNINRFETYLPKKYCWAPHFSATITDWKVEYFMGTDCRLSRTFCY